MLLKRSLVLAAGVLLYIAAFTVYFEVCHAQMEGRFRDERKKFGVEGAILTTTTFSTTPAAPSAAQTSPTPSSISPSAAPMGDSNAPAQPAAIPDANAVPSASTPADPSGAPAASPAPADNTLPSAPAAAPAPDPNAAPIVSPAPATPPNPSSTQNQPLTSVFQDAAYRPFTGAEVHLVSATVGQTATDTTAPASTTVVPADTAPAAAATSPAAIAPAPLSATRGAATEGSVIVLLYHQFKAAGVAIPAKFQWTMNVDVFEAEMKYIHDNGYNVISMADLLKFLKHQGTVPPRAVCITIDDGYKSAIVFAAPVLKKYGYPWTYFIYPDFITVGEGPGAASWNDVLELQKEGIDIESHSMTHPNLKSHHQKIKGTWHNLSDAEYADWLKNETAGAKAVIEQHLGRPVPCFAYPYGEYNTQVENAAIAAGYEAIFTVADNPVHSTTSLHSIGRYTITQGVEKNFAAYLRQGALGLSEADPAPGATTTDPRPIISATLGYPGTLDPKSIETSVRDFGDVRHDFDPQTNTVRLYLPRDLVAPVVLVNIRVKDAASGQIMVANWHFNYEPSAAATGAQPASQSPAPAKSSAPTENDTMEKNASGTPLDKAPAASPAATTTAAPAGTRQGG